MRGPVLPPLRHGTLTGSLAAAARSGSGLSFLTERGESLALPYSELLLRARRVAHALIRRGVRRGDAVALILPTAPSFPVAFFGALLAGAIPTPLYPPVRLGRLAEYHGRTARMLGAARARLVLTDDRIRRLLGETVERARPVLGCATLDELEAEAIGETGLSPEPEDVAVIQFSSGSTTEPKAVALTHRNVLANLAAIDAFVPERRGVQQVGVSWLPLYHDMGLVGCLLLAVHHPGPLTLIPPERFLARPAVWLRAISAAKATLSVAPNFAFGLCLKRIRDEELTGVDLSSWKIAFCGAEPISPAVLAQFGERFSRFGFDPRALTPVYGLSEATLAVTFSAPRRRPRVLRVDPARLLTQHAVAPGSRELVSLGTPVAGVELAIRDEAGRKLQQRKVGRIWVRGPGVMAGYRRDPAATARALRDGWLDTGDLGFFDRGELFLCGRAKDLVIVRGRNHAPQEFEESLDGLPGLRAGCNVAVGFVPAGADGEELAILAEHEPGAAPGPELPETIRAAVLQHTGVRAHTVLVLPPGTLPRTSSGKLRRSEARRRLEEDHLSPPEPVGALRLAGAMVRSSFAFAKVKLLG